MAAAASTSTYILLDDLIGERVTRGERYKTIVVNKGALLKGPIPTNSQIFSVSTGNPRATTKYHGASVRVSGGKESSSVAPLSKVDYRLLKGVAGDLARYEVYTSGRLELNVGDNIFVKITNLSDEPIAGVLRWRGTVHQKKTIPRLRRDKELKFGIEILDKRYSGRGNSSGRLNGVRYFHCGDNCGCFVVWHDLYLPSSFDDASDNQSIVDVKWAISTETLLSHMSEDDTNCELAKSKRSYATTTVGILANERLQPPRNHQQKHVIHPATSLGEWWEIPQEDIHISTVTTKADEWECVSKGILCGQTVAVKRFHWDIISQLTKKCVLKEIGMMAQVHHPNLLLFIGAVLDHVSGPHIVTEILDQTLQSAYEDRLLTKPSKLLILRDVASALNYLHSNRLKIAYGAVDSNNILLEALRNDTWKAKLSDFASVRLIHLAKTKTTRKRSIIIDGIKSSVSDILPDAEFHEVVSPEMDVYCFGELICEILFNKKFPIETDTRLIVSVARHQDSFDAKMGQLAENCTKHLLCERLTMSEVLMKVDEMI